MDHQWHCTRRQRVVEFPNALLVPYRRFVCKKYSSKVSPNDDVSVFSAGNEWICISRQLKCCRRQTGSQKMMGRGTSFYIRCCHLQIDIFSTVKIYLDLWQYQVIPQMISSARVPGVVNHCSRQLEVLSCTMEQLWDNCYCSFLLHLHVKCIDTGQCRFENWGIWFQEAIDESLSTCVAACANGENSQTMEQRS